MTKKQFTQKVNGQDLDASEWNELTSYVNQAVDAINNINTEGVGGTPVDTSGVISVSSKGNTTLSATKHVNIEPAYVSSGAAGTYGDVQIKPGDDITLESHHRILDKRDEITIKTSNGQDEPNKAPVKLQFIASDMTLSTKGKTGSDSNVMNVNVTTGQSKGYLKVRAQAIDLRCEEHGGIALQPKGYDGDGNMNKIKFEHGGGDGLEFGTFNTEKSSLYTDEYRFKKDGIWKMATRATTPNTKTSKDDNTPVGKTPTTQDKYVKQPDDFYDIIDSEDETATTKSIIKTAHALNDGKNRHSKYEEKITSSGNLKKTLEIETVITVRFESTQDSATSSIVLPQSISDTSKIYTISDFKDAVKLVTVDSVAQKYGVRGEEGITLSAGDIVTIDGQNYIIVEDFSPSINIASGAELSLKGKEKLSLGGGVVEFGSDSIDLGEMEDGLYAQYKLTKKNNSKACDVLKVKVINNQTTPLSFDSDAANFVVDSFYPGSDANHPAQVSVPGKVENPTNETEVNQHIQVVAQCKLIDVIKFVTWAKANHQGPWAV